MASSISWRTFAALARRRQVGAKLLLERANGARQVLHGMAVVGSPDLVAVSNTESTECTSPGIALSGQMV